MCDMKNLLVLLACLLGSYIGYAQQNIDVLEFVENAPWSLTGSEINEKYKENSFEIADSVKKSLALSVDGNLKYADKFLDGFYFGKYNGCALYTMNKDTGTPDMFLTYIYPEQISNIDKTELMRYTDSLLYAHLGEPDYRQDDYSDNNGDFVMRTWVKGADLTIMITSLLQKRIGELPGVPLIYSVTVKKVDDGSSDFRDARWGDSMSQVVKKEGRKNEWTGQMINPNVYSFSSSVADKLCDVLFFFTTDDKLIRAKYYFTNISVDGCIDDYKALVALLSEKYGTPEEFVDWSNPVYAKYGREEGYEVYSGNLSYWAYWNPDFRTEIFISLQGIDGSINLAIQYSSCVHEQEAKEDRLRGL